MITYYSIITIQYILYFLIILNIKYLIYNLNNNNKIYLKNYCNKQIKKGLLTNNITQKIQMIMIKNKPIDFIDFMNSLDSFNSLDSLNSLNELLTPSNYINYYNNMTLDIYINIIKYISKCVKYNTNKKNEIILIKIFILFIKENIELLNNFNEGYEQFIEILKNINEEWKFDIINICENYYKYKKKYIIDRYNPFNNKNGYNFDYYIMEVKRNDNNIQIFDNFYKKNNENIIESFNPFD